MRPDVERHPRAAWPEARAIGPPTADARPRTRALVALLADDSPQVLARVRQELSRLGKRALPALRRAARSAPAITRARARQVLLEHERRNVLRRVVKYAARERHDLQRALMLLDSYQHPGIDHRSHLRALTAMGTELEDRLARSGGERASRVLADYLAGEIGFGGAREDYHHPDNIQVSRAIERRQGIPLTLCAIYAMVARRAGLDVGLLPFPGHVLLSVRQAGGRDIIDPFSGGQEVSEEDCVEYLSRHGLPYRESWLRTASDTAMFLRHVLNLRKSFLSRGRHREARALEQVLGILAEHPAQAEAGG